ncbi:pentapeptide repeat-containing protein [Octadecabacter sp.]|nr:pentapeptide repeat-containing protein [Octadecabacter sp.]
MDTSKLKPANENPWYILMTLYGEQEAAKNLQAWVELEYAPRRESIPEDWQRFGRFSAINRKRWDELRELLRSKQGDDQQLPSKSGPVVLQGLKFEDVLDLTRFSFLGEVLIENCVFEEKVVFDNCYFAQNLTFKNVTFRKGISMRSAGCRGQFKASGLKMGPVFTAAGARFGSTLNMTKLTWLRDAPARETISFNRAQFDSLVHFSDTQFPAFTVFESTAFKGRTMFSRARFPNGVSFRGAVFEDFTYFQGTQFGVTPQSKSHQINFTESRFERPPTFRQAEFKGEYPNFAGAILHPGAVFTAHEEHWPQPKTIEARYPEANALSVGVALENAALIRAHVSKQGLPDEEHFFFRREMALVQKTKGWAAKLPFLLYDWVSDYGHSVIRPMNGLLLFLVFGVFLVQFFTDFGWWKSLAFSFANMFRFFGLQGTYFGHVEVHKWDAWLQWALGAQTVCAFILLFFLGLGLRTRFRLR